MGCNDDESKVTWLSNVHTRSITYTCSYAHMKSVHATVPLWSTLSEKFLKLKVSVRMLFEGALIFNISNGNVGSRAQIMQYYSNTEFICEPDHIHPCIINLTVSYNAGTQYNWWVRSILEKCYHLNPLIEAVIISILVGQCNIECHRLSCWRWQL